MPIALSVLLLIPLLMADLPIDRDDIQIRESATPRISEEILADANGDGVIQIVGDHVVLDLAGQTLRGDVAGRPDQFTGVGVRITGKNVTLKNARIRGYKIAIWASGCDGLTLEDCDVSANFCQRLGSSAEAEAQADWLWPHQNDSDEWRVRYGAGIYIEDARDVTVRRCRARQGQNGLCLDRVNESQIYDNDFSFLSGWGIALWRSSRNVISRNSVDFCVRGYSHGVYNRGQDSAGLLVFEQCSENTFAENSATHCGDGFFGFAGREALGEVAPAKVAASGPAFSYRERGCNENLLIDNDFSFAAAHGVELTFSFHNAIRGNRIEGNAICGVWGGYSQGTLIQDNEFIANGDAGYGLERGGVNIEHGRNNRILHNRFSANRCGVHLWSTSKSALAEKPWGKANGVESLGNLLGENTFDRDALGLHLRGVGHVTLVRNRLSAALREREVDPDHLVQEDDQLELAKPQNLVYSQFGEQRPVGRRAALRGRDKIVMTEWGPYDWERPYLQRMPDEDGQHVYRALGVESARVAARGDGSVKLEIDRSGEHALIRVSSAAARVTPYTLSATLDQEVVQRAALLVQARWSVRAFGWSIDPRTDVEAWRAAAMRDGVAFETTRLDLPFGNAGPSQLRAAPPALREAALPKERFGVLAQTRLDLPAGDWRLTVLSDDGVRLYADDQQIIDNWTWHGPTRDSAVLKLDEARTVALRVEYFELDGYAVLKLDLERE